MKSLNSFADHAPKRDWLVSFFELKEDFFTEHTLGPMMYDMFRRFLRDAGLNEKNHFTDFAELISNIGWETDTALGLVLVNLAMENPQIAWYIKNMDIGYFYERKQIEEMLISLEVKPKDAKSSRGPLRRRRGCVPASPPRAGFCQPPQSSGCCQPSVPLSRRASSA